MPCKEDKKEARKKEAEAEAEAEAKKRKTRMKEAEDEAEDEEAIGRYHKDADAEAEDEDAEEAEEEEEEVEEPKEGIRYKKKPKKKKKEADAEEEEEEEEETEKGEMGGVNPAESASMSTSEQHTTTTRPVIGSRQHVLTPTSNIAGTRIGRGTTPSEVSYTGKSVEPDLLKSPLFVELSGQIEQFQKTFDKKILAVEKSVSDRLANIQKAMEKVEAFYKQPMYKAVSENVSPESVQKQSIKEQIEKGKIRFVE
jgi:hypothetical protein